MMSLFILISVDFILWIIFCKRYETVFMYKVLNLVLLNFVFLFDLFKSETLCCILNYKFLLKREKHKILSQFSK